jgi:hypothetical protein
MSPTPHNIQYLKHTTLLNFLLKFEFLSNLLKLQNFNFKQITTHVI